MTKTAVAAATPDERDEKIAKLEKQVSDLVDAIVQLAGERPVYIPCQMPHYPQPSPVIWTRPFQPTWAVSAGATTQTLQTLHGPMTVTATTA